MLNINESDDQLTLEFNFDQLDCKWVSDRRVRIPGRIIRPKLCDGDLVWAIGHLEKSQTLIMTFSKVPIKNAEWTPCTIDVKDHDIYFSAGWSLGHAEQGNAGFLYPMESALIKWLGKIEHVHHICYAAWQYKKETKKL